uniref:Ribonuclease H-like domain-containing protein n=1 Tax=Tanacetum cinerariifolium TaxID=118510 RepID=A0A6L2LSS3_TANCI|nr:ribonuclease H-like domain-containing protein [Tanacetum cinerariifolium]
MSVRQVWKRKTSTPKSSPSSQKDSTPLLPRDFLQSPSPPSYNPLRDQMINQLHNISTILDSHTNPSNAYIHAPLSPPLQQIYPPSHAQVEFYLSFCHDDDNATNPPPIPPTQQAPHTLSTIKLLILKKEGLHKGNDRFQSLLSQLEIHGAGVSTKDANQKFLQSLPSSWSQVAMISIRLKKFYKKTGIKLHFDAKEPVGFDKTKVECFNCQNTGHFARECRSKGNQESRRRDAGNTGYKARDNGRRPPKQDEPKAMVIIDRDGVDWTGHAEDDTENYALLAFNFSNSGSDTMVTSCSKECEESYAKLKKLYDEQREQLGDASIEIQAYTLALKKMSAKDKSTLGYRDQIHEGVLSYENEFFESVMNNRSSDVENSHVYDRFAKVKSMHIVPPPVIRIHMPPKFNFRIDGSKFTYGLKQSKTSESDAKTSDLVSCESNSSVETLESVPKLVLNKPKAVSEAKVWSDAPIIKEYESDKQNTCSQNPKVDKRDRTGLMSKRIGLGYGFTRKACFVCGSFSHLIRDCDFQEKRTAKHIELNKRKDKGKLLLRPQQVVTGDPKDITETKSPNTMVDQTLENMQMTGKKAYLVEYQEFNGGLVAFGGSKGQITGKGKIQTGKLDFKDVYFVKELHHFNLFSVSQMCDKKNKVLFIDTECKVAKIVNR